MSIPYTLPLPGGIPDDMRPHTERTTTILVPKKNTAFLNPVQEYNRDTSVAVIRAWNDMRKEELEAKWRKGLEKGKNKQKNKGNGDGQKEELKEEAKKDEPEVNAEEAAANEVPAATGPAAAGPSTERQFKARKITILEALSATGLRSIRYAKEIPDVKVVLANDLSASACDAMRTNVALNGVGEPEVPEVTEAGETETAEPDADLGRRDGCTGVVRVNEGDACALMYAHRAPRDRVDVVDLDPYGTAAPFIDAAISSIADGGLLAVTCTDLAILAGNAYPEKCFSSYGGVCVTAEWSHEVALRLVLNSIAQAAARYGRTITPLISLSIDFYVRLFLRVDTRPIEVKRLASQTGMIYNCSFCQTPVEQRFGKIQERQSQKGTHTNLVYRAATNTVPNGTCDECGSPQHVAGPMWLGPIHDPEFVGRVISSIDADKAFYGTYPRMHGMLSLAQEELSDLFYFSCNKIAGFGHVTPPPTKVMVSALLNAGYKVSRSHARSGSVKTDAPRSFIFDVLREWAKGHPVRFDKVSENSPTRALMGKEMTHTVDLTLHPDAKKFERDTSRVNYQMNPLPNWGPAARARDVKAGAQPPPEVQPKTPKRKNDAREAAKAKRAKVETTEADAAAIDVDDEEAAMNAA